MISKVKFIRPRKYRLNTLKDVKATRKDLSGSMRQTTKYCINI